MSINNIKLYHYYKIIKLDVNISTVLQIFIFNIFIHNINVRVLFSKHLFTIDLYVYSFLLIIIIFIHYIISSVDYYA